MTELDEIKKEIQKLSVIKKQAEDARHEQRLKKVLFTHLIIEILLITLLVATNVGWIIRESQFQTVKVQKEVVQDNDNGTNSYLEVGGDNYGETNSSYDNNLPSKKAE